MKTVILAGGLGTRLAEETGVKPKPMVEIGELPILWHIMKIYNHYGLNDFIICLGYKGYVIKEFFQNYLLHRSDVTIDAQRGTLTIHKNKAEPWRVTLVETGAQTMTGGRIKRVKEYLDESEPFCMTYGDAVSDVRIDQLIEFHKRHGKMATVTAVRPLARFGSLLLDEDQSVSRFEEKPMGESGWINGGFFVLNPSVLDYIADDSIIWEREPMEHLVRNGQIAAFQHDGYWQPMDTLREKELLEEHWRRGAPWKVW